MTKIMLFGQRGSGKDTALEIFAKYLPNFKHIRLAGYVVEVARAFGIENPTRTELVLIGEKMGRNMIGKDVWINKGLQDVRSDDSFDYVISDVRYPNEYEAFKNEGFIPILIDTELETCIERVIKRDGTIDMKLLEGESEKAFRFFGAKFVLDNNGTIEELEAQIIEIVNKLTN